MGSEDIDSLCANMTLMEKEGPVLRLEEGLKSAAGMQRLALSLVGKSVEDRCRILARGPWIFDGALILLEEPSGKRGIENMVFNYSEFWVQIHRVPLLCMTKEIGHFLGSMVGVVKEIDVSASRECSCDFLRVTVVIDITKPLQWCLRVDVMGDGDDFAI
ncbi:hypothetical protein Dsin_014176 [Dipteronia sinensis]|uniref:DUF4283 domain-containing protein n=1 Tax=Dipteronia sinensis TaxID=43782 RepID=A0AAE0E9P4_9ROSI|nr:hypothetical protein Dsin_014176 [Dipteronia sinensis]